MQSQSQPHEIAKNKYKDLLPDVKEIIIPEMIPSSELYELFGIDPKSIESIQKHIYWEGDSEVYRFINDKVNIVWTNENGVEEDTPVNLCYDIYAKFTDTDLYLSIKSKIEALYTDVESEDETESSVEKLSDDVYLELTYEPDGLTFTEINLDKKSLVTDDYFNITLNDKNKTQVSMSDFYINYEKNNSSFDRIINISGKLGYGKTLLVKHLMNRYTNKMFIYINHSFISGILSINELYNFFRKKNMLDSDKFVLVFDNIDPVKSDTYIFNFFKERFFSSNTTFNDKCKIVILSHNSIELSMYSKESNSFILNEIGEESILKIVKNELKIMKVKKTPTELKKIVNFIQNNKKSESSFLSNNQNNNVCSLNSIIKNLNESI